jgi:hypothetical protein
MKNLPLTVLACALLASAAVPVTAAPAKAAKPAKAQNETPAARMEIALAHQLGSIGEENLQRLVERYNSYNIYYCFFFSSINLNSIIHLCRKFYNYVI